MSGSCTLCRKRNVCVFWINVQLAVSQFRKGCGYKGNQSTSLIEYVGAHMMEFCKEYDEVGVGG